MKSNAIMIIRVVWITAVALLIIACLSDAMYLAAGVLTIAAVSALPWPASLGSAAGRWRGAFPIVFSLLGFVAIGATAKRPAADTPPPATAQAVLRPAPIVDPKPAFIARYKSMLALAKPCDKSIGAVGAAASRGEPIEMYSEAKDGQASCEHAFMEIGKIEPDDNMPVDAAPKEEKAVTTCRQTYFLRQRAMETAMSVADGDARASKVVSFKEDLQAAQLGLMLCVGEWMSAGSAIGVKAEDLK